MKTLVHLVAIGLAASAHAAAAADQDDEKSTLSWLAPDAVFGQLGRASETTAITVGAIWDWNRQWRLGTRGILTAYGEFSLGHWRADQGGGHAVVTQVGFTPTLRYWPSAATAGWFVEGAVGFNVLTPVYRTREKSFSTAFNFGDHVALGYRAREGRPWEWALRFQHFSNAGIEEPNPGENFIQLRVVVPLDATAW